MLKIKPKNEEGRQSSPHACWVMINAVFTAPSIYCVDRDIKNDVDERVAVEWEKSKWCL